MSSECEKLIQFDTEAVNSDISMQYSALQFINQDNYEEMKSQYSISIPGYFEGSYGDFKKKRNTLSKLFMESGRSALHESYYRHTLSRHGAELYADCIAKNSNKQISAWVEAKSADEVTITVKCGLIGVAGVNYKVHGEKLKGDSKPTYLTSGSSESLIFERDPTKDFVVVINALNPQSQANDQTVIGLPAIRKFEVRSEVKELRATLRVGAGGNGNKYNGQIYEDLTFVAEDGYLLDTKSVAEVGRQVFGPGLATFAVEWIPDTTEVLTRRLIGHPKDAIGVSVDGQGIIVITYRVNQKRSYVVEVTGGTS